MSSSTDPDQFDMFELLHPFILSSLLTPTKLNERKPHWEKHVGGYITDVRHKKVL